MLLRTSSLLVMSMITFTMSSVDEGDSTIIAALLRLNNLQNLQVSEVAVVDSNSKRIVSLALRGVGLKRLIPEISSLDSLKSLDVGFNELDFLPEGIWRLPVLWYLDLSNNNITRLPDSIVHLDLGKAVQDSNGLMHIIAGLCLDSNKLCSVPQPVAQWIDAKTSPFGTPTWRTTQRCGSNAAVPRKGLLHMKGMPYAMQFDLKGRAIVFSHQQRGAPQSNVRVRTGSDQKAALQIGGVGDGAR